MSTAQAAGFEFLGPHGDWDVFADQRQGASVCYVASVPVKASHKERRGEIYMLVTRRKTEGFKDVVSFHQGYPLKSPQDVQVKIGGQSFTLFPSGDTAWAYDAQADAALVKAMRAGATLSVQAVSTRGTKTTDTYSLKGISAAHNELRQVCG